MRYCKINKENVKKLLSIYYELDYLEANGINNWLSYIDNRTRYINEGLKKRGEDFSSLVEIDLTEYKETIEKID